MKFRFILVLLATILLLCCCSWVTGNDHLISLMDYEKEVLEDVFGEEGRIHADAGQLTGKEYNALMAYRAGAESILSKYPSYNIKMISFFKQSDNEYEIEYEYQTADESVILFTCFVTVNGDEFECTDNLQQRLENTFD